MEHDRAQVDLGVAVDIEEKEEESAALRQPKKRFVGRRQAEEAASKNTGNGSIESSGAIKGQCTRDLSKRMVLIPLQFQLPEELLEP
jgi:2-(3-amino-3-carboxypropyl)histidine synthase